MRRAEAIAFATEEQSFRAMVRRAAFAALLLGPRAAYAQVHWDMGLSAGVMQRLTTGGDPAANAPTPGPMAELRAHVAVVPMLRAGAYFAHDISPVSGMPARQMTEGGLRLKLTPPLLRSPWHVWTFVGLGYALTYVPSYLSPATGERVQGTPGGLLELPFGVGLGVKLRGPWTLFAELGGRAGLLFTGTMYQRPQSVCAVCADRYVGRDSFAAALSVGVSLEQ